MAAAKRTTKRQDSKKKKLTTHRGVAHINSTSNNTIVTITTEGGDTIAWRSCGAIEKNARKSTSHAASEIAIMLGKDVVNMGLTEVYVRVKGLGSGRESAIRGLYTGGLKILKIRDITPNAHGGCRARKEKRN